MKSKVFLFITIAIVVAMTAAPLMAQQKHAERIDKKNGFSIITPEGFTVIENPGSPFKGLKGPEEDYTPTIAFAVYNTSAKVDVFVIRSVMASLNRNPSIISVKREAFTTSKGLKGERVIANISLPDGRPAIITDYYFPGNKKIIQVNFAVIADFAEKYNDLFEETARSFELTN